MAENFWLKFKFKDWADDVKPLSLLSRGLLIELIIYLNKNKGVMPVDVGLMVRISGGLTEEIKIALKEFRENEIFDFKIEDGIEYLISRKITKEIHKSLINKENGLKGGNPKLKKSVNRKDNRNPNSISNSNSNSDNNFKEKPEKKFVPPTLDVFKNYFAENGFLESVGERAWKGYDAADWKKANGKPVLNWKQTCQQTWFTEENKIKSDSRTTLAPSQDARF